MDNKIQTITIQVTEQYMLFLAGFFFGVTKHNEATDEDKRIAEENIQELLGKMSIDTFKQYYYQTEQFKMPSDEAILDIMGPYQKFMDEITDPSQKEKAAFIAEIMAEAKRNNK